MLIPASAAIVEKIGVQSDSVTCLHCQSRGHYKFECPARWGEHGNPLPGWRRDGAKEKGAWVDGEPTTATYKAWIKFLGDSRNFVVAAQPARVEGAPTVGDFRRAAGQAAGGSH